MTHLGKTGGGEIVLILVKLNPAPGLNGKGQNTRGSDEA
jgi:hypothetical protein